MTQFRSAIIGCGGIHHLHAQALAAIPNVKLMKVCDIREDRARASAEKYGAAWCTDLTEIISDPDIDVVHVTLPHDLHAPVTLSALRAKKAVVCEKPMATSIADAKEMIAAANGRLGMIFQNRYNKASQVFKQIVTSGEYGALKCIRGQVAWLRNKDYYSDDWHGKKAREGGGVMMNQAIHTLDMVRYLAGPAKTVSGVVGNLSLDGIIDEEDTAAFRIRFENGAIGIFFATVGYGEDTPVEVEAVMEKSSFWLRGDRLYRREENGDPCLIASGSTVATPGKACWGTGHVAQLSDFYHSLATGEPIFIDGVEGFGAFALIQALYASAAQGGKEVPVAQPF